MADVVYRFQGVGADDVLGMFDDIDARAKRSGKTQQKESKRTQKQQERTRKKGIGGASPEKQGHRERMRHHRTESQAVERTARKLAGMARKDRNQAKAALKRDFKERARLEKKAAAQRAKVSAGRRKMARSAAFGLAGVAVGAGAALAGAVALPAARQGLQREDMARSLAIQGRGAGQQVADPRQIAREATQTAIKVGGIAAEDVMGAMSAFVTKTGKADMARAMAETFGVVARATGADAREVGSAAADMMEKFDIKTVKGMQSAMAALTFQGKEGAFELADAAAQFPKILSAAQRLGVGKGEKAVRTIGGITQIARQATGSGAQAATAVEAMFRQLTAKSGVLSKQGVEVFDKQGGARDIVTVLTETLTKVGGGDLKAKRVGLQKIFGEEGIKGLAPLISTFGEAMKKTGGDTKAAGKAVRDQLNNAINATGTWADVVEDAAIANESAGAKMTTVWEQVVAGAQGTLVPAITDLASNFVGLMEGGGFDLLAFGFDVAAESLAFMGEAAMGAADALRALGIIKGDPQQELVSLGKKRESIQRKMTAKVAQKKTILGKVTGGEFTTEQSDRISQIDAELLQLEQQRKAVIGKQKAVKEQQAAPLAGAEVIGAASSQTIFTPQTFEDAMVKAANLSDLEKTFGGEESARFRARAIQGSLQGGGDVSTFGMGTQEANVVQELRSQLEAFKQGVYEGGANVPEDAIKPEVVNTALASVAASAAKASQALATINAERRADVGG